MYNNHTVTISLQLTGLLMVAGLASGVRDGTQKLGSFFFSGSFAAAEDDDDDEEEEEEGLSVMLLAPGAALEKRIEREKESKEKGKEGRKMVDTRRDGKKYMHTHTCVLYFLE